MNRLELAYGCVVTACQSIGVPAHQRPDAAGALCADGSVLFAVGLYMAFFVAPPDYQQGETVRIMFVHVPSAWLAMFGYLLIAISALGSLIWRHPLADVSAKAAAPIGAAFTFLALVTGALVGQADVGRLLGVGRAAHLVPDAVFPLSRADRAVGGDRGAVQSGPRHGDPCARGRRQHPDHQVFGRLVEHAAPADERDAPRRPDHRRLDPVSLAGDGAGVHMPVRDAAPEGDARRNL